MASNPYVNKVQTADGIVLIDLSQDTVTSASDIVSGKVGHLADGSQVTGTASAGGDGEVLMCNMIGGPLVGFAKICPPPGIGNVMIGLAKVM